MKQQRWDGTKQRMVNPCEGCDSLDTFWNFLAQGYYCLVCWFRLHPSPVDNRPKA